MFGVSFHYLLIYSISPKALLYNHSETAGRERLVEFTSSQRIESRCTVE